MMDLITFTSSALSGKVVGLRGTEAMSRPYHFEIFLQTTGEIDWRGAVGAGATVALDRATPGFIPFFFSGVLAQIEVVHAFEAQILVRAHLVPRLWRAGLSRHSRVFTGMRIPDIVAQVLRENGVSDYELRLGGQYDPEDHVCQFRESDLDFISRWMEREGIYYFFEHGPEGERLVLADGGSHDRDPLGAPVLYAPQLSPRSPGEPGEMGGLRSFRGQQSTLPAHARFTDYDETKPHLEIAGSAAVQAGGAGQVVLYGERLSSPPSAARYARLRAEELLAREVVYRGAGGRLHLRPGYQFDLEGHPLGSFNAAYLTVEARHSANQAGGHSVFREVMGIEHGDLYQVEVSAVPAQTQFRPERRAAWPRVHGYENGVIDGPADSPYAQIDDQGRYKVKLKFDEGSPRDGQASTWVRMMTPHGGEVEGFHFPLRRGTEVVIGFLDGDVDRPVIFGVVPNAVKPSPVTQSNHTRNVVQTGGRNRLELEDQAGSQWAQLSTPSANSHLFLGAVGSEGSHNVVLSTQGTGYLHTGGDWDVEVGGARAETVTGEVTEDYESDASQTVAGDRSLMVYGSQEETVLSGLTQTIMAFSRRTILGPYTQLHTGPHTHVHKGAHALTHVGPLVHTHEGPHTRSHHGPLLDTHVGPLTRQRTGTTKEALEGQVSREVKGGVEEKVSADVAWEIGGEVRVHCKDWQVHTHQSIHHHQGNSVEITKGTKTEVVEGARASLVLGLKEDVVLGGKHELHFPGKSQVSEAKSETSILHVTECVEYTLNVMAVEVNAVCYNMAVGFFSVE